MTAGRRRKTIQEARSKVGFQKMDGGLDAERQKRERRRRSVTQFS